nr:hypothetical protein [Tanacetum cinerariifolium]
MCEMACQIIQKKQEEKRIKEEQAAKAQNSKILVCYDDDDDYNSAITPNEPIDSLSMGDEHLNTILATESEKFIKSCVETLVPNPRIDETDCYPEEEIHFTKRLLYDNSSPCPPEEFVFENFNADIESFFPSPIPNEDSDSFMKEIDFTFNLDNLVPPGIEEDDDDSERDMLIHEELLENYSLSLLVIESFYFDIPSFSRPLAKPLDGNIGILNIKIMGDNSDQKVHMPKLMITRVSNQEKSTNLLSHRGLKIFKFSVKNIPTLDVPLFHFYPLDQLKYGGNWVKLSDLKQALRGRHPMLIIVQYSRKLEDSCQRILSSKSSFPQLQLGI